MFDQGTPAPLRRHLGEHEVETLVEKGWSDVDNGRLIEIAESEGYDVLVTTDQNMRFQQNLTSRQLAVVVLLSTAWPDIQLQIDEIRTALDEAQNGEFIEVAI